MTKKIRVMVIFGTRPEAIKMAPVLAELHRQKTLFTPLTVVTGQHKEMLAQCLDRFKITPDHDLAVMTAGQTLEDVNCSILKGLPAVFDRLRPDVVLVQGDTTTSFATALSAFYHHIPIGHVEAGLRTHAKWNPFPEEMNRHLTGVLADLHFAPTEQAKKNLLAEGIPKNRIYMTGNTIVDALQKIIAAQTNRTPPALPDRPTEGIQSQASSRLWLLTLHRRESFGKPMEGILKTIKQLITRYPDVELIYPVHPNPKVREIAHRLLANKKRIHLLDPVDYFDFVGLQSSAYLILTDSGGVQEEAPSLGKPVLVLRETTERPEGVAAGVARLVGTDPKRIIEEVSRLMDTPRLYRKMVHAVNPYGDGQAAQRIVKVLAEVFGKKGHAPVNER
jgi:UDP-N-acetylglucosamine 2-epimerase (non-hydrolysing)